MQRMCPIWPLHIFIMYAIILIPMWLTTVAALNYAGSKLPVDFDPSKERFEVYLDETAQVPIHFNDSSYCNKHLQILTSADSETYLKIPKDIVLNCNKTNWSFFNISGVNLGTVVVTLQDDAGLKSDPYNIAVLRDGGILDKIFIASVATLVSIIYINFGCALDLPVLKKTIIRPIGPAIGFVCQFLLMPLISYGVGAWLFPDNYELRLGLFYTGLSPAGGASNIWSVALDANVNLSVTMTTISTIAAFAMFPFWLFTLGDKIFDTADLATPYGKVAEYLFCLVVPLAIGMASQIWLPRFARIMTRILKPFSAFLILFIIIFACVDNSYIFGLFTWKIAAAGLLLPWLGYFGGFLTALFFKQPMEDMLAIAVETGVQNTGIAIFMIKFSLGNPAGDIATVIPVAVSVMTPIPLALLFIYLKIRSRRRAAAANHRENMLEAAETDSNFCKEELNGNHKFIKH